MYHYEWTRTVSDIHDETGILKGHNRGQNLIRDRLSNDDFGTDWEKRGTHRAAKYYMSEETFQTAVRMLRSGR